MNYLLPICLFVITLLVFCLIVMLNNVRRIKELERKEVWNDGDIDTLDKMVSRLEDE